MKKKIFILLTLVLCMGLILTACNPKNEPEKKSQEESEANNDSKKEVIEIGCMSITEPIVDILTEEMEEYGYEVKSVMFDGNHLPATALKDGEIDGVILNHLPWLETFNEENNCELVMPEPYMYYSRTAVYSTKHDSIDDLPEGAQIVVPGDPANLERALVILRDMGLIELSDEKKGEFYSLLDVTENFKNIEIIEGEITATMRSIDDVDAVVGGANTANRSGLDPNKFLYEDPIALEFPLGLIVDKKDEKAEWVKDILEVTQQDSFREKFVEEYDGTYVLFDK